LRWACSKRPCRRVAPPHPDYEYYRQVARRIDHNRACPSVARKLCRRAYHILRELGDEALAPIEPASTREEVIAAAA
jgi:transposase